MSPPGKRAVEICVTSVASAIAAELGGADRVELCADLSCGGITPGPGTIALACERLTIPVHVLIRPRPGDFVYDANDVEVMCLDIREARRLGASGVVIGALNPSGDLDEPTLSALIAEAGPLSITCHKAFDAARDPIASLRTLHRLGVSRVLTSGGWGSEVAADSLDNYARLQALGPPPTLLAGGRVRLDDLPGLRGAGLQEIHLASAVLPAPGQDVSPELVRRVVDGWKGL